MILIGSCALFKTAPWAYLIGADWDYEALVARVVGFVEALRGSAWICP
jgi:hypothetical protein